jgi:hypothetical protein
VKCTDDEGQAGLDLVKRTEEVDVAAKDKAGLSLEVEPKVDDDGVNVE